LVRKSLSFDYAFLGVSALPATTKARLLLDKYWALTAMVAGRRAIATVGAAKVTIQSVTDLGTLQSCVTDFDDEVIATSLIPPNPIIVDVGANIGQFCIAAKLFYPTATIYSFEPDPDSYAHLVANTDRLDSVHTFNIGLGSKRETLTFHRHPLSVMSSFTTEPGWDYAQEVDLPIERLDDVLTGLDRIDLLKIDVEGFEYEVLAGAESVLQRTGAVIVEVRLGGQSNRSNLEVIELLHRVSPSSQLVTTGRVLRGANGDPICFDVVVKLR
jgi:FkbM family methyltransferase